MHCSLRHQTILVTGGTGSIGTHLLKALDSLGYNVRALTRTLNPRHFSHVDWRLLDMRSTLDFDRHLEGCTAVLHLGVEKSHMPSMRRVNVEATSALAAAAALAGVRLFCHMSSVSVYGSPRRRRVDEETPLITAERDVPGEYWATPVLRAYARSKAAAERALQEGGHRFRTVILRPTIARSAEDIRALGGWSLAKKLILAGRLTHTLAIEDIVDCLTWWLEKAPLDGGNGVEVFNLATGDAGDTYSAFFDQAFALTHDPKYRCPPHAPVYLDRLMHWLKFRTMAGRWPMGMVQYSCAKLEQRGWKAPLGPQAAYRNALVSSGGNAKIACRLPIPLINEVI